MSMRDGASAGLAVETAPGVFHGLNTTDKACPGSLDALIAQGGDALKKAADALARGRAVDVKTAVFAMPLAARGRVICIGLNYRAHAEESGHAIPKFPTVFPRFTESLVAHNAPLIRPKVSTELDYEGEFVIVIGKGAHHVPVKDALSHVAGYSIFNDGSVRDYQMRTPQWAIGKNFDNPGSFGPYFVTADALPPGASGLRLRTRVNGMTVQDTLTSDLIFDTATLVSLMSDAFALNPGDIIVTGTPSGVGGLRKPQLFLKPGDICEVEVEGIGVLRNPVADEK